MIIRSKQDDDDNRIDIIRNNLIPSLLLNILKNIIKIDGGKMNIDLVSDIIKTSGLLTKSTFDKHIGIDTVYLKQLLPLIPTLMKIGGSINDIPHQTLLINIVRFSSFI